MALDTTVGGAAADSYMTLAEANSYHSSFGNATWVSYTDQQKEAALRRAAVAVDSYPFSGRPTAETQARAWPRECATRNGWEIDSATIPNEVKDAQCEMALRAAASTLMADVAPGNITEKTVGPLTVKYSEYSNDGRPKYPFIDAILRPLFGPVFGNGFHRVVRT